MGLRCCFLRAFFNGLVNNNHKQSVLGVCLLPCCSAGNGSSVSIMRFLLWQEVLIRRGLSGVLMFFREACFLIAVLYKALITWTALGQENTDVQVLVILTAEALPSADWVTYSQAAQASETIPLITDLSSELWLKLWVSVVAALAATLLLCEHNSMTALVKQVFLWAHAACFPTRQHSKLFFDSRESPWGRQTLWIMFFNVWLARQEFQVCQGQDVYNLFCPLEMFSVHCV